MCDFETLVCGGIFFISSLEPRSCWNALNNGGSTNRAGKDGWWPVIKLGYVLIQVLMLLFFPRLTSRRIQTLLVLGVQANQANSHKINVVLIFLSARLFLRDKDMEKGTDRDIQTLCIFLYSSLKAASSFCTGHKSLALLLFYWLPLDQSPPSHSVIRRAQKLAGL